MLTTKPPIAKKNPKVTQIHGVSLVDDYFWMRDKQNPAVTAYLEAENKYTDAAMQATKPLQQQLYVEMLSRIKESDVSVPYKEGCFFYFTKTEQGKQYPVFCRKKTALDATEEIVLDMNALAANETFMSLGAYKISPDGNFVAYSTDNSGFRQYDLHVKDLTSGKILADHAAKVGSVVWANDNKTLFYTVEDAAKRQYQLYRYVVGTQSKPELLYEEKDERFSIHVEKSLSHAYLFLVSSSHTTSEVRYLSADQPNDQWQLIEPRQQDIEYYVAHNGDKFYLLVNDTGRNFRLVTTPVSKPAREAWQEIVPHRSGVMLESLELFKDYYVLHLREAGLPKIVVTNLKTDTSNAIAFAEPAYDVYDYVNHEFDTTDYLYVYQSFVTPMSIYSYDMQTGQSTLLKQKEVPGNYRPERYVVERTQAAAADGVNVPISILRLKDAKLDHCGAMYLYGYGSYGYPYDVDFNSNLFSLVDRGMVVALAHIRGGGDNGKAWHDAGRMMHKKNTFTDFIACAEYLLAKGYGTKSRLVIEGRSAGGLLMGAVLNMRPDLFAAAILEVPFVDVINTMLDESLPLTTAEFEEWGNPKQQAAFEYMLSYSPYDNIEAKAYPNMLVQTSLNDSQVMYWEPAKYVAKMRDLRTDHNVLLLKTNLAPAGHGGASGRYDRLHEVAFKYAFILSQVALAS